MTRIVAWVFVSVSVLLIAGCQDSTPKPPPVAKANGTVTLDGKPMDGGEVRFNAPGQPVKSLEIKGGAFSGEVYVGNNRIDVVWEKDGPPHPMEAGKFLKVNAVDSKFSGVNSPFKQEIAASGASDLKFEVTSGSN